MDETLGYINDAAKKIIPVLIDKFDARAFSTRVNYGESQEIKHYHMHLLPDYGIKKCNISQDEAWNIIKGSNIS